MAVKSIFRSNKGEQALKAKYKDLLRHWPIEKEVRQLETRGGSTQVLCCGDLSNPPLVLLHGAGNASIRWLRAVETFCKSHRIYAVDIPGEPNNSAPIRFNLRGPDCLQWLEDIFSELKLPQAALVGENLGAWICMQFACHSPDRVNHLALLSPAGVVGTRFGFKLRRFFAFFLGPLGKSLLMKRIAKGADYDSKFAEYYLQVRKHFKPRSYRLPKISDKTLAQLYCPVLLLIGKKDVIFNTNKVLMRLARNVPQIEINYRKNDGHWLSNCTREIDRFLVTQYPAE